MSELARCPVPRCFEPQPHSHAALGEGLFAPADEKMKLSDGNFVQPSANVVTLHHRCPRCRAEAYRPFLRIGDRQLPAEPVERLCDRCLDRAERATLERTPAPARSLKPPRRPVS